MSGCERRSVHALGSSEVEVGFINRSHFYYRRKLSENRGDAIAPFAVELIVTIEKYGLEAELCGGTERHRRVDTEFPCFVTRGGNHAALIALASYDYGQAAQFRSSQQLN